MEPTSTPSGWVMIDLSRPQRQSPLAIILLGIRIIRSIGLLQIAIVFLLFLRGTFDSRPIVLVSVLALILAVASTLAWWRYTFQLVAGELIVTKGVVRVDRLTVPIDRIQSISMDQELLHRLTGLVKVTVDTAGSEEVEFAIDAVERPVAEELQRQVVLIAPGLERGAATADVTPVDRIVLTHDPWRLLLAALTMSPLAGLVLLAPVLAGIDQFRRQVDEDVIDIDPDAFRLWWLPVGLAAFAAFSVVLNLARTLLQDWGLTLRASSTTLRRTAGLFTRTSRASSISRLQVVSSSQNPLQHRVGLRAVELSTIGGGDLRLPGCDDDQFDEVCRHAETSTLGELGLERRVHPAEVFLATRNAAVGALAAAAAASWVIGWWSLLALLLVIPAWFSAQRHVRNFRWSLGAEIATFDHIINRTTRHAQLRKANGVTVTQTIFERRRGLGRVHVSTAAGTVSVGMIPIDDAEALRDAVLHAVETDDRDWM